MVECIEKLSRGEDAVFIENFLSSIDKEFGDTYTGLLFIFLFCNY